jgi:hypothetical protein
MSHTNCFAPDSSSVIILWEKRCSFISSLEENVFLQCTQNSLCFSATCIDNPIDICGNSYPNTFKLKVHKATHNTIVTFECYICHKKVKTEGTLWYHKKTVHRDANENKFKCDVCQKAFLLQSAHWYGLAPECLRKWIFRSFFRAKIFPHSSQVHVLTSNGFASLLWPLL